MNARVCKTAGPALAIAVILLSVFAYGNPALKPDTGSFTVWMISFIVFGLPLFHPLRYPTHYIGIVYLLFCSLGMLLTNDSAPNISVIFMSSVFGAGLAICLRATAYFLEWFTINVITFVGIYLILTLPWPEGFVLTNPKAIELDAGVRAHINDVNLVFIAIVVVAFLSVVGRFMWPKE